MNALIPCRWLITSGLLCGLICSGQSQDETEADPNKTVESAEILSLGVTVTEYKTPADFAGKYRIQAGAFDICASEDFSDFIIRKDGKLLASEYNDGEEIMRSYHDSDGEVTPLLTIDHDLETGEPTEVFYGMSFTEPDEDLKQEHYSWVDKDADGMWDYMIDRREINERRLTIYDRGDEMTWSHEIKQGDQPSVE